MPFGQQLCFANVCLDLVKGSVFLETVEKIVLYQHVPRERSLYIAPSISEALAFGCEIQANHEYSL